MNTAAILQILVTANTKQATAALAKTNAQLKTTAATANASGATIGSKVASGAKVGAAALVAVGVASVKAAADFESSFAEVRKSVDANEKQYAKLAKGIRGIALEVPVAATELAELAGQAGALGVARKDLVAFTRTAAELGIATDMSAEQATNTLARLTNIMGTAPKDFRRLGSTMVKLGSTTAATESEIGNMALRIGASGRAAGLSEADVLAYSAALASVGVRAEAGGSSISKAFDTMNTAVIQGGKELGVFADTAGMSTEQFASLFEKNAAKAMMAFTNGLKGVQDSGGDVVSILDALELGDIRVMQSLRGAAQAGELLKGALKTGGDEWERNSALTKETAARTDTLAAQWQLFKNHVTDLFIEIGNRLNPVLKDALKFINSFNFGKAIQDIRKFVTESEVLQAAFAVLSNAFKKIADGVRQHFGGLVGFIRGVVKVITGVLTLDFGKAWDGVKDIFRAGVQGVISIFRTLTAPFRAAVELIAKALRGPLAAAWNFIKKAFATGADFVLGVITTIVDGMAKMADAGSKIPGPIGDMWDKVQAGAEDTSDALNASREDLRRWADDATKHSRKAREGVSGNAWGMSRAVVNAVEKASRETQDSGRDTERANKGAGDSFEGLGNKAKSGNDKAADSVRSLNSAVNHGIQNINDNVTRAMKLFGVNYKGFKVSPAGVGGTNQPVTKQRGGPIPGAGKGDTVPAMLEPGEYVVNSRAVAKVGVDRLDALNFGAVPRFQKGGAIGMQTGGLSPGIQQLASVMSNKFGFSVSSGLRPGDDGFHGQGLAADLTGGDWAAGARYINSIGPKLLEGIYNPAVFGGPAVSWDSGSQVSPSFWGGSTWAGHQDHIHAAIGAAGTALDAAAVKAKELKRQVIEGPDSPLKDLGQAALDKTRTAANKFIESKMPKMVGTEGVPSVATGPVQRMAEQMVLRMWGKSQWPPFVSLEMAEAGWNPRAVNASSGAAGLAQALPPSKYPPGAWPYTGPESARLQLEWMMGYIKERYGTPSGAWAWHQAHNWYKEGGVVLEGDSLSQGMKTLGGGFPSGWQVDAEQGRRASTGAGMVPGLLDKFDPMALVFALGTNDNASIGGALSKVKDAVGKKIGLAFMTTSNNASANRAMKGMNRADAIADWGAIAGDYLQGDVHPAAAGYKAMQELVKAAGQKAKDAAKKRAGGGGGGGPPGYDGPWAGSGEGPGGGLDHPGSGPWQVVVGGGAGTTGGGIPGVPGTAGTDAPFGNIYDWAKLVKNLRSRDAKRHGPLIDQAVKAIGKGTQLSQLTPEGDLSGMLLAAQQLAEDQGANADFAEQVPSGKFGGIDPVGWVKKQIETLFALRNGLIQFEEKVSRGQREVKSVIDKLRTKVIREVEKRVKSIQKEIDDLNDRKKELEKKLADAPKVEQERREAIQKKIDAEKKKKPKDQDKQRLSDLQKQLEHVGDYTIGLNEKLGDNADKLKHQEGRKAREQGIVGSLNDPILVTLDERLTNLGTGHDNVMAALEQVQGRGVPMDVLTQAQAPIGTLKGDIGNAQVRLHELMTSDSQLDSLTISELQEFAQAVQLGAFNTSPFMGAFQKGGVAMVGEAGPELVHMPSGTRIHNAQETQAMVSPDVQVHVYVGDKEITDMVTEVVVGQNTAAGQKYRAGRRYR